MQTLILSSAIADQLTALALASPDREVCGLLGGHGNQLHSFYPIINIAAEPEQAFLLDGRGQIDAMRNMRECGENLRGIFHSHPRSPAAPSLTDRRQAYYADLYYLITSLLEPPQTAAYYYDGVEFTPVALQVK